EAVRRRRVLEARLDQALRDALELRAVPFRARAGEAQAAREHIAEHRLQRELATAHLDLARHVRCLIELEVLIEDEVDEARDIAREADQLPLEAPVADGPPATDRQVEILRRLRHEVR